MMMAAVIHGLRLLPLIPLTMYVPKVGVFQGENDPYDFSVKYNAEHIFWTKSDTTVKERYGDEYIESAWVIEMRDKEAGLILERKQDRYLAVRCVKDK